jgi:4-alpha-glucanotransferase
MKIGQLSFTTPPDPPSGWSENTIGYTGTHDNDTTRGWWEAASEVEKERAAMLAGVHHSTVAVDLLRAVWTADSVIAIAPVQEILGLGTDARMNLPGTVGPHNWTWRLDALPGPDHAARLRTLNQETGRQPNVHIDSHSTSS